MKQETSKLSSLTSSIALLFITTFFLGVGFFWLLQLAGVTGVVQGLLASQLAIAIFVLTLFDFNLKEIAKTFKFDKKIKTTVLIVSSTALILGFNVVIGLFINMLEIDRTAIDQFTSNTTGSMITGGILAAAIMPVVVAPILEELAFRAGLKRLLVDNSSWKPYQYVIISSIMFGLLHFQPGTYTITPVLLTGFMGAIHAVIYLKTKNILIPIMSHMIYNLIIMYVAFSSV